jgi:hypothetical protein
MRAHARLGRLRWRLAPAPDAGARPAPAPQVQTMMEDLRREADRRTQLRKQGAAVASFQSTQQQRRGCCCSGLFGGGGGGGCGLFGGCRSRAAAPAASLSCAALGMDLFGGWCGPLVDLTVRL